MLTEILETKDFGNQNYNKLVALKYKMCQAVEAIKKLNKEFSAEEFKKFRHYFTTRPIHNLAGASGLYSAAFPTLDYLLQTELPIHKFDSNLMPTSNKQEFYTTRENLSQAKALREESGCLLEICQDERFKLLFGEILQEIQKFRQNHMGAVRKNIPEVFEGRGQGTGGVENPVDYLNSVINTTETNRNNI